MVRRQAQATCHLHGPGARNRKLCSGAARTRDRATRISRPRRLCTKAVPFFIALRCFGAGAIFAAAPTATRNPLSRQRDRERCAHGTFPASGDFQRGAVIFRTESSRKARVPVSDRRSGRSVWSESCPVSSSMRLHGGTKARRSRQVSPGALSDNGKGSLSMVLERSFSAQPPARCSSFPPSSFRRSAKDRCQNAHEGREGRSAHSEATTHPAGTEPLWTLRGSITHDGTGRSPSQGWSCRSRSGGCFRKRMDQQNFHAGSGDVATRSAQTSQMAGNDPPEAPRRAGNPGNFVFRNDGLFIATR